jgi:hypothetical protein
MKGSESQIKFANDIIAARKPIPSLDDVLIGGNWLSGDDGRKPAEEEIAALNECVRAVESFDDASIVIQTKGMDMAQILKRAEQVISLKDKIGIMKKDEFATKIPADSLLAAADLIQAIQ